MSTVIKATLESWRVQDWIEGTKIIVGLGHGGNCCEGTMIRTGVLTGSTVGLAEGDLVATADAIYQLGVKL